MWRMITIATYTAVVFALVFTGATMRAIAGGAYPDTPPATDASSTGGPALMHTVIPTVRPVMPTSTPAVEPYPVPYPTETIPPYPDPYYQAQSVWMPIYLPLVIRATYGR